MRKAIERRAALMSIRNHEHTLMLRMKALNNAKSPKEHEAAKAALAQFWKRMSDCKRLLERKRPNAEQRALNARLYESRTA